MSNDTEFLGGIRFQAKRENAPSYVLCRGWIDLDELIAWAQAKKQQSGENKVNFDVKESQGGKIYGAVDNWKPQQGGGSSARQPARVERRDAPPANQFADDFADSDIPFATNRGVW